MKVIFLGRELGEASEWDGEPGVRWWVNDFVPIDGVGFPKCDTLEFDEDDGKIRVMDKDGNSLQVFAIEWRVVSTVV